MAYFGKINNLEINAPSGFSVEDKIVGGYNETLMGTRRRYIKAAKKVWTLRYDLLSTTDYDAFYTEFEKEIPEGSQTSQTYAVFTVYDSRMSINEQNVHIDISERNVIPGTDLLSSVEITLTQV